MSRIAAGVALLVTLFATACSPAPEALGGEQTVAPRSIAWRVVAEYPHDRGAFTQGLAMHEGVLYEGTGIEGASTVRIVDLATGVPERIAPLGDEYFGEGITVVGDRLVQLTWQNRRGFVYDRATLALVDSFVYETEGWGLAFDGSNLVMSDGTETLQVRDPATYKVLRTLRVTEAGRPVPNLNELEYVNGVLYANIWRTDDIVRIDPATGRVTGRLALGELVRRERRGDVLNGIAWDAASRRLLVTGKHWGQVYALEGDF